LNVTPLAFLSITLSCSTAALASSCVELDLGVFLRAAEVAEPADADEGPVGADTNFTVNGKAANDRFAARNPFVVGAP
jgi:hypothetical protein